MIERPRRNRKSVVIREMIKETRLHVNDLVLPLFVQAGNSEPIALDPLPGNYIWSPNSILKEIENCLNLGIHAFILFPKVAAKHKDKNGSYGINEDNFYLKTAREIKKRFPNCVLISDVALDPYNSDGHDGIVHDGVILNDESVEILCEMAILQGQAGFDILGPSDMMDGRVGAIREALDQSDLSDTSIMSYTAKYASGFYGPFRDALDSAPVQNPSIPTDKKTYQMSPANKKEALREADLDTAEGADFLMVKPAVHYMDVIHLLKSQSELPIAAYHVSGECAMLHAAAEKGYLHLDQAVDETLLSLKRAGADVIISYFTKDFAMRSRSLTSPS